MRVHADERRTAYCGLFDTPGDVNLFIVNPGQRTCWHRHQRQTDQFRVIRGAALFGIITPNGIRSTHLLEDPSQRLIVHRNHWHGYENIGTEPAYILMYLDRKYDPTDEERMSEDVVPWGPFCDYCQGQVPCQCGTEHDY